MFPDEDEPPPWSSPAAEGTGDPALIAKVLFLAVFLPRPAIAKFGVYL
jgi:hypothetical protein